MRYLRASAWVLLLFGVVTCLAQSAADTRPQIAEHTRKLQQYLQEKKADLAIVELKTLVKLDPANADLHGNLGVLLFFQGDCAQAIPELRSARAQRAELWRLQFLQAVCERRTGEPTAALTDFETAFPHLEDAKVRFDAGMELIDLYSARGDFEKAVPVVETLRAHDPTNPAVLYATYRIHTEIAGAAMLALAVSAPGSAQMHLAEARETLRYGDPAGAIAQYRAAMQIDPKLPGVHFELAEVLRQSLNPADKKEAESEYRLALANNPGDGKALCRIGEIDAAQAHPEMSYQDYAKAVQLAPTDVDAVLGLAQSLLELNRTAEALPLLQKAVQLEPENDSAHYLLSRLYMHEGKKEDAQIEVDLYKKYKDLRSKLNEVYKQMRIMPASLRPADSAMQNDAPER